MKYILKNNLILLSALIVLTFVLIFFTNRYILTNDFYEKSSQPLSGDPALGNLVYQSLQKWIYLGAAIYLIVKISSITLVLYAGLYLFECSLSFSRVFKVVLLSEFIFLVPAAIKIAWFYFGSAASYLLAWQSFYVLSALSLFGPVGPDWFYALQTLNAFEIAYWFLLAYGLFKVSGLNYDKSLKVVLLSYVPALLIWVTIITFCSLLMFPATG